MALLHMKSINESNDEGLREKVGNERLDFGICPSTTAGENLENRRKVTWAGGMNNKIERGDIDELLENRRKVMV